MPQPEGPELDRVRARRDDVRDRYLRVGATRPAAPTRGIHHAAFICRDVEETVRFYQEFLGFPLVELVENRDYAGSSHFFFDVGGGNLLGFFDFPGHEHPAFGETIGGIQHLALSVDEAAFTRIKGVLDAAGMTYLGPDRGVEDSLYIEDPNGLRVEFYMEERGVFAGKRLVD